MNHIVTSLHRVGLALLLTVAASAALRAQDPRDALVARAFNEFDVQRRVQLLMGALNPTAGPPRGAWPVGVQLLAQTLMEDGKEDVAAVWLRWAIRLAPDLQPNTVQFLPRVVSAYRTARDFVQRSRSRGDDLAPTTWLWPTAEGGDAGGIQIASSSEPLRVEIEGIGLVAPGGRISLPAGSYAIGASVPGRPAVRVTREVLPGATTVVEFRLRGPQVAQTPPQPAPPAPAPEPIPVSTPPAPAATAGLQEKKGFPILPVAIGGVAVLALLAVVAGGGGDDGPDTGSITITFPNP